MKHTRNPHQMLDFQVIKEFLLPIQSSWDFCIKTKVGMEFEVWYGWWELAGPLRACVGPPLRPHQSPSAPAGPIPELVTSPRAHLLALWLPPPGPPCSLLVQNTSNWSNLIGLSLLHSLWGQSLNLQCKINIIKFKMSVWKTFKCDTLVNCARYED